MSRATRARWRSAGASVTADRFAGAALQRAIHIEDSLVFDVRRLQSRRFIAQRSDDLAFDQRGNERRNAPFAIERIEMDFFGGFRLRCTEITIQQELRITEQAGDNPIQYIGGKKDRPWKTLPFFRGLKTVDVLPPGSRGVARCPDWTALPERLKCCALRQRKRFAVDVEVAGTRCAQVSRSGPVHRAAGRLRRRRRISDPGRGRLLVHRPCAACAFSRDRDGDAARAPASGRVRTRGSDRHRRNIGYRPPLPPPPATSLNSCIVGGAASSGCFSLSSAVR